ncbi:MAG TPA: sigma factor G inhibitor Gin, partial [Bacillota bacterium]|nr:sigma factor G inhibitor Gin [Bacillota bacterium]
CEDEKKEGIHLYNLFICSECEYNMIHTEPREEKYQYYVRKLKAVRQSKLYS